MSTQRLPAFNKARIAEYMVQCGWQSYVDARVDCIQNERDAKYISQCGWKSYVDPKI
jgi:peptide methionine sulfoxide reductase MsrB